MSEFVLRRVLVCNAAFSLISGLCFLVFAERVVDLLGIAEPWMIRCIGAGLGVFALEVLMQSLRKQLSRHRIAFICLQDFLWVLGSLVLMFAFRRQIFGSGHLTIAIVAIVVAVFAWLQFRGLKSMTA